MTVYIVKQRVFIVKTVSWKCNEVTGNILMFATFLIEIVSWIWFEIFKKLTLC
jgi:hypothetical protein